MRTFATLIAAAIVMASGQALAEIYRYSDADGVEHFTTNLAEIPEQYRDAALERAKAASSRINIVGPKPSGNSPRATRSNRGRGRGPAKNAASVPLGVGSERHWRKQFSSRRSAIQRAEREVENAEAADRTTRGGGRSSTARGAQARWAGNQRRENRAEARIERAEAKLEAAEDAMHELRQRAVERGVPDAWMR